MGKSKITACAFAVLMFFASSCGSDSTSDESTTTSAQEENASAASTGHDAESHGESIEVPEGMEIPAIEIDVSPDKMSGYNLTVSLESFTITPENASTDPVDGEGHMHLLVDGEKVARFYSTSMHLGDLEPGEHEIAVEISANNHSAYAVGGEPIRGVAQVEVVEENEMNMSEKDEFKEVSGDILPAVELEVFEDPKSGWNIRAVTENFTLSSENASGSHVDGEGHMHLMVDGEKVARLYGEWWHLPTLSEGEHTVSVVVNANDHVPYAVDGEKIMAEETITVTAEQAEEKSHDHGSHKNEKDGDDHADMDHSGHSDMEK